MQAVQYLLDVLYRDIDGYSLATEAQEAQGYYFAGHQYQELSLPSLAEALAAITLPPDAVFYDLGSGAGRQVFSAHLLADFSRLVGVELLQPLHTGAMEAYSIYNNEIADALPHEKRSATLTFINETYYTYDFSDGDVLLFAVDPRSLVYELAGTVGEKLEGLKRGAVVITDTWPIASPSFEILASIEGKYRDMSNPLIINRKISERGNI